LVKGINTVTWTATDGANLTATSTQTVTVVDNQPPTIATLAAISVNADAGVCTYDSSQLTAPTASDNCTTVTVTRSPSSLVKGINTVTWTATDGANLTATSTQTVTVVDSQPPTITCPTDITTAKTSDDGTGNCTTTVALGSPIVSDNCTPVGSLIVTNNAPSFFPTGTTTVTWTVRDTANNTSTCTQNVTVIDNEAPTIICPANITTAKTSNDGLGNCTTTVALGSPIVSDNCTPVGSLVVTNNAPAVFPIGTTTVTWTVKDAANNTSTCIQNVIVIDDEAPSINCPANVQVAANAGCTATVVLATPITSDNCSVASVTNNAPVAFPLGSTTVTWTATDASGNTATCTQTVTVLDQTLPTAICQNISVNLNASGTASITAADINNNSTDNCGIASLVASKTTFNCANLGTNSVTLTVTDTSGNVSSCIATVAIVDAIAPVALCKPFTLSLNAAGNATLLATDIDNGSSDNCSFTRTISKSSFNCSNLGANTVTLTITDAAGNSSSCTATVTVQSALTITATSNSVVCAGTTLNLFGNITSGAFGTPTYSWTGPLGFNSTLQNPSITNVSTGAAGTYTLTVINGNGCTITQTTTVIVNSVPNVSINPTFTSGFVKKSTNQFVLYTYTITNIGSVADIFDLSAVWINDNADSVDMDIRFKVGATFYSTPYATPSIAPGGTFTFQVELQVQGNAPRVLNHTKVTATSRLCSTSSISADMYTYEYNGQLPTASAAQLELSKTANTASAIVGVPFDYVITIVNNSSSTSATGVVISDQVPANLTITNNGGGLQSGQTITWNIGTLTKIGAGINAVQKTITVVPTCALVPTVTNTANVFSTPPDNGLGVKVSSITIPVTDNIPPTAKCKPITVNLNASGVATITESIINDGSTDNCSIQAITLSKTSFNCSNLGSNNVTLTVTDISGNTSSCTSLVTVVDNQVPVFASCPTTPAALCADNLTTYTKVGTSWDALATDNCSFSLSYTLSGSTTGSGTSLNGVAFNVGTTTVTWTAIDTGGNTSNCIFSVTINGLPATPIVGIINQPDCVTPTGNVVLSGLPIGGTINPGAISYPGTTFTISGLTAGLYNFTVSNSTCTSLASTNVVINPQPLTPVQPILAVAVQPACFNATGSIAITNYNAAYTYTVNPNIGVSISGGNITAPVGNYTVTATLVTCTSVASSSVSLVAPGTPTTPTIDSYTMPTFANNDGTVIFSGLPVGSWVLTQTAIINSVTTITTINGSGASTTLTGLEAGSYTFEVATAVCVLTRSVPTPTLIVFPYIPVVSPATGINCSGFNANWPATPTATAYLLDVSTVSTFVTFVPGYHDKNVGNVLTYPVTGMPTGTLYYRIRATNAIYISLYSATIMVTPLTNTYSGGTWTLGTPPPTIGTQNLVFNQSFTANTDLSGCSCTVNSGDVIIKSGKILTITNGVTVKSPGTLTFEDTSSLVQINNVANSGNITYKRETTIVTKFDYTYWSTPVLPFTLGGVSPTTLGDKFYSFDSSVAPDGDWQQESAATPMDPGVGYIIRGPQENWAPNPPATAKASFVGVPNNGHYEITGIIVDRSYLLGNPYPSALDADDFLVANKDVLNGTLYFWTHNSPIAIGTPDPGSGLYAYSGNDYAAYNATGGVATINPPDIDPNTGQPYPAQAPSGIPGINNDNIPTGKIASGQGFFGSSKVTSLPSSPKIVYDNTMRVGVIDITKEDNSQFYKTKNPKSKTTNALEKHRVWLDLTNSQGAFKQTLVGYITDATNGYEDRFDGESYDGNDFLDFYSILQDKNLTIQGRALPFDQNDEIPLGYRVALGGTFSIVIDQIDGLLSNRAVFIEDKLNNTIVNLKNGRYTFSTTAGTFDDRFVLRYTDKTLSIEENEIENDGIIALYSNNYKTLIIRNNLKDTTVNSVTLYNMGGQKIAYWDVKGREQTSIQIPIRNLPSEIYIVKVKTTKGEFSKKIIIK